LLPTLTKAILAVFGALGKTRFFYAAINKNVKTPKMLAVRNMYFAKFKLYLPDRHAIARLTQNFAFISTTLLSVWPLAKR
jgi:hypothetical protein